MIKYKMKSINHGLTQSYTELQISKLLYKNLKPLDYENVLLFDYFVTLCV